MFELISTRYIKQGPTALIIYLASSMLRETPLRYQAITRDDHPWANPSLLTMALHPFTTKIFYVFLLHNPLITDAQAHQRYKHGDQG
jgi:hypothetical protein